MKIRFLEKVSAPKLSDLPLRSEQSDVSARPKRRIRFLNSPKGETQWKQDKPYRKLASDIYTPVMEMVGMGASIPATAMTGNPVVGSAAGIAGMTGMTNLARELDYATGLYERPKSKGSLSKDVLFKLKEQGEDFKKASVAELGGVGLNKFALSPLAKVLAPRSKKLNKLLKESYGIAKREGIEPSPGDMPSRMPLSILEAGARRNPASAGVMNAKDKAELEAYEAYAGRVQGKIGPARRVEDIGGDIQASVSKGLKVREEVRDVALEKTESKLRGSLLGGRRAQGLEESGDTVKRGLRKKSRSQAKSLSGEYESLPINKDTRLDRENLDNVIEGLITKYGEEPVVNKDIVSTLEWFRAKADKLKGASEGKSLPGVKVDSSDFQPELLKRNPELSKLLQGEDKKVAPTVTWEKMLEMRARLSELVSQADEAVRRGVPGYAFLSNRKGGAWKTLKKALDKDIEAFSKKTGKALHSEFRKVTKNYAENAQLYGHSDVKKAIFGNPEKVVKTAFQYGNITGVKKLKAATDADTFKVAKDHFTEGLLNAGNLKKELAKYGDEMLGSVYTKSELRILKESSSRRAKIQGKKIATAFETKILGKKPEEVYDHLIRSSNSGNIEVVDAANIGALNNLLRHSSPKVEKELGRKFIERAMTKNKHGLLSPDDVLNKFASLGPRTAKRLLGKDGLKEMKDLAKVSEISMGAKRASRGLNQISMIVRAGAITGGLSILISPVGTATLYLTTYGIAKLYTSKAGRKLLLEGFVMKKGAKEATKHTMKLLSFIGVKGYEKITEDRNKGLSGILSGKK